MSRFSNSRNDSPYDSDKSLPTSPISHIVDNDDELDYQVGITNGVDYESEFSGWSLNNATNISNSNNIHTEMHARRSSFGTVQQNGDTFFAKEPQQALISDNVPYSKPLISSATLRLPSKNPRFSIGSSLDSTFSSPLAPPPQFTSPLAPPPQGLSTSLPPPPSVGQFSMPLQPNSSAPPSNYSTPLVKPVHSRNDLTSGHLAAPASNFSQPLAPPNPSNLIRTDSGYSQPISPLPPTGKAVSGNYSQPLAPPRNSSMAKRDTIISPAVNNARVGNLSVCTEVSGCTSPGNNYYSPTNIKAAAFERSSSQQPPTVSASTLNTKAYKAAVEFLTTERSYVNGLRTLSKCQLRLKHSITLKRQILAGDEISKIFGNIEEIFKLNEAFLKDLETASITGQLIQQIPGLLQHYLKDFKCYSIYSIYYESAMKYLAQLREQREDFKKFLELEELCENTNLESFLITPVQRVPRYLLLTEILSNPMFESLSKLAKEINETAVNMNSAISAFEGRKKVQQIQNVLFAGKVAIVTPSRFCVRSGDLKKLYANSVFHLNKHKKYLFILFNDMLLYATRPNANETALVKHVLPLLGMTVESVENGKCGVDFAWEITSTGKYFDSWSIGKKSGKSFIMYAPDEATKSGWVEDIKKYIAAIELFAKTIPLQYKTAMLEEYENIESRVKKLA